MFERYIRYILVFFILSFGSIYNFAFGQQEINFTSITNKQGLSSNTINAIIKDHCGLMWFGTADGLDKFDGTNVTSYRYNARDSTSLPANEILSLYEDREGRIWIASAGGGVTYYDRNQNSFVKYLGDGSCPWMRNSTVRAYYEDYLGNLWIGAYDGLRTINTKTGKINTLVLNYPDKSKTNRVVMSFFEDSNHCMWVGTSAGLYLLNRKTNQFTRFIHQDTDTLSLSNNVIEEIAEDHFGNLWIGTIDGLDMLPAGQKNIYRFKNVGKNITGIAHSCISAITVSGKRHLWLATNEGIAIIDVKSFKTCLVRPDQRNSFSLSQRAVSCIYTDKDSIYWVGTIRGGINKFDKNLALFNLVKSNAFDKNGLRESVVTSFAEDDKQTIFVGTDGGGLHLFDRKTGLFKHFDIRSSNNFSPNLSILALETDKTGKLWIGTFGSGLFYFDTATGKYKEYLAGKSPFDISENDIFCIKADSKGNIWVGTNGNGVDVLNPISYRFIRFNKIPENPEDIKLPINGYMRTITEDDNGNIWLGSFGSGLAIYHPKSGRFTVYNKKNSNLKSDDILSILNGGNGLTWIGTDGGGISVYDQRSQKIKTYEEKDGLINGIVYKILQDKNGIIWLSTDKGITSFNPTTKKFKNFSINNGLQDGSFIGGSGLKTSDGELFFGGQDGFNYFKPFKEHADKNTPQVLLTELKVANNPVKPAPDAPINMQIGVAKEIRLQYGQNFSISYVCVDYTNTQQNQYAYKLAGYEKAWNYVGLATTAYYTNIDPGDYVFQVRAINNEGVSSNKITIIHVKVLPPFWGTVYAYIFYVLMVAGALFYIRYRGIQKIKNKFIVEQEKEQVRQLIEQERREAEKLHELDLLKIKFLTNLSHEFRTPISLIMAPADKLLKLSRDVSTSGQVQMIRRNAKRLLNLVNQLLDFRKMEEHELKLNLLQGDLIAFVKDAANSFQDISERKKIYFNIISEPDQLSALFDHDKIERIIFNLLSNAFKFTHQGGTITVELAMMSGNDKEQQKFQLKISDTGIGISADQQDKIFERFFQHHSPDSILNQGSGIGLSITKEFVLMHGGEITVNSKPGVGTVFTINLPVIVTPVQEKLTVAPVEKCYTVNTESNTEDALPITTDSALVLIVEDNEDFRFYLKDNLKTYYHIIEASNGKEGWQKALSCHPQLIVSDINMPYMDGLELSAKLKADKRTSHIPIVLLTATVGEEGQLQGLESGANDYLIKPFNFEILNAKIKSLLLLKRNFKDAYSKQLQVVTENKEIESNDAKLLRTIVKYIDEKLNSPDLSVEDLSKHVGMSRGSLYTKLLELTGLSPVEYIRSIKLERAALLLEKSEYNVAQIAYMTGFGTPSYFSKLFKEKFHVLPSEYLISKRKDIKSRLDILNGDD